MPSLSAALGADLLIARAWSWPWDARWPLAEFLVDSPQNFTRFASPEYDSLWQAADTTTEEAKRSALQQKMQRMVEGAGAALFLGEEQVGWLSRGVSLAFTPYGTLADLGDFRSE